MAKSKKLQQRFNSQRHRTSLHKVLPQCSKACVHDNHEKRPVTESEKKEWKNAVCSVCMEFPHNAVLLLCSSYDKGCRPYMCATSHRFSNCLEQYTKAYTKVTSSESMQQWPSSIDDIGLSEKSGGLDRKNEKSELLCPLCRGQVKGWTVVDLARRYLNAKKRTCTQDNCSFVGTYKKLRKHVKLVHPLTRPRDVDPSHVEKWKKLENERDLSDVFSTIRSTMPGAIVMGDYVIERNPRDIYRDYDEGDYLDGSFFRSYVGIRNGPRISLYSSGSEYDSLDDEELEHRARAAVAPRRLGNNASRNVRSRYNMFVQRRRGRVRTGR